MRTKTVIITAKQKRVLDAILSWKEDSGNMPTLDDLRLALGYANTSSVQRHMTALIRKGVVSNPRGKARSFYPRQLSIRAVVTTISYEVELPGGKRA